MGTSGITNLVNDFNLINVDIPKNNESNGEFAKTFENASQNGDLEMIAKRDVNIVEELKTSDNAKDNYLKETNGGKFENKVEAKETKNVSGKEKTADSKAASNQDSEEITEEETKAVDEAIASIINAYCEVLNISPEEFENLMQENNLSVSDLIDPSKVQSIVMELGGITDSVEILTDDSLFDSIKNIEELTTETVEDISKELGIDENELKSVIDENFRTAEENVLPETDEQPEKVTITKDDKKITIETNGNESETDVEVSETGKETAEVKKPSNDNNTKEKSSDNNSGNMNAFKTSEAPAQANGNIGNVSQATPSFATDAQQIYDQIGEYIRNVSAENINEVELRLQPETLGTIQVRVTQSEGVMKAELVTNNENVRAIIEGQLIQLKEDFDHSGIRVDEVEVRVSTNEFNENAQQESRDEANERAARETHRRNINLSDGIELDEVEEYEDDEKIAVEMMAANGNSMDYRA